VSICVNPCLKKEDVFREGLKMEKEKTNLSRQLSVISHRSSVIRYFEKGSAFILVVVLTTLLMLIGVVFLMSTRVEKLSTSAVSQEKDLQSAVGAVIEQISQQLVWDSPGIYLNQEYYDYPDPCNLWLANLEPEPNAVSGEYQWRQISNIYPIIYDWYNTGYSTLSLIEGLDPSIEDYPIINDYQIDVTVELPADSDGDGVADSRWVMIPDISTSKGEPVLAAVRVVDNSAMLNVNTAYKFDPDSTVQTEIDGRSQLQINLFALSARDKTHSDTNKVERLGW